MNETHQRSKKAEHLHWLIQRYCLRARNPDREAKVFAEIEEFLNTVVAYSPDVLLEINDSHSSFLTEALHSSYAAHNKDPMAWKHHKAEKLVGLILDFAGNHLTLREQAILLTTATRDDFTPLHDAVLSGNFALYEKIHNALESLQEQGELTAGQVKKQYTLPTRNGITPLMDAINSGDTVLARSFFADIEQLLTREEMQQQLQHRSQAGWNIFHSAHRPDETRGKPNPLIEAALQDLFFRHFGNGRPARNPEARAVIETLYHEETPHGFRAIDRFNTPEDSWQEKLRTLSDEPVALPER